MQMPRTVRQILHGRERVIWSVEPDDTVFDALKLMADKEIGAVMVLERGNLVGIFTERDYARKVILRGRSSKEIPVKEIMSARVAYIRPDQTIEDCMALMSELKIRHLPVMDGDEMHGMVSMRDVVSDLVSEQDFIIEQLVNYIHQEGYPLPPSGGVPGGEGGGN